eukprot:5497587-Pleurochrysis_carterae.AAC.1
MQLAHLVGVYRAHVGLLGRVRRRVVQLQIVAEVRGVPVERVKQKLETHARCYRGAVVCAIRGVGGVFALALHSTLGI